MKILLEKTDENHAISISEITQELADYGFTAERKSLYDDIETLGIFGLDIEKTREGGSFGYYIAERDFQMPELKLLVDSVQCSKFITPKKTLELIRKLEKLCSENQAKDLQREVLVSERVKTVNENIYYITDIIHTAILSQCKIEFAYFDLKLSDGKEKIKKEYRKNKAKYKVSPYALTWDDENYYLVAYDEEADKVKHYRVDKMDTPNILEEKRAGEKEMKDFNIASYAKKTFGMFGGEECDVTLEFSNDLLGVVIDRFGSKLFIAKSGKNSFKVNVRVALSPVFYSWLFNFGTDVKIISPHKVANEFREKAKAIAKHYKNS